MQMKEEYRWLRVDEEEFRRFMTGREYNVSDTQNGRIVYFWAKHPDDEFHGQGVYAKTKGWMNSIYSRT